MRLKDICTIEVACCTADATVTEAARLMRAHHVGDLVVIDEQESRVPLGIITDRDLVVDVLAGGLDLSRTLVGTLMHRPVVIARDEEDSSALIERMRTHAVRRVPVVDRHGAVSGIVTLDDLLRVFVEEAASLVQIMARGQAQERRERR